MDKIIVTRLQGFFSRREKELNHPAGALALYVREKEGKLNCILLQGAVLVQDETVKEVLNIGGLEAIMLKASTGKSAEEAVSEVEGWLLRGLRDAAFEHANDKVALRISKTPIGIPDYDLYVAGQFLKNINLIEIINQYKQEANGAEH